MIIHHVALVCRSEESSDLFYREVLGLEKIQPKILSSELSEKLFQLKNEYPVLNYVGSGIRFEIFISPPKEGAGHRLEHICLEVEDLNALLRRCEEKGVKIIRAAKGDSVIVFVADMDGNLFELKEKK